MEQSNPDVGATASFVVVDPSGHRSSVTLDILPFRIGRQADNQFVVRDNRASRVHAQIVRGDGGYWVEDLKSRHGTFVNGERVERRKLQDTDRIEFGSNDSYQLIFSTSNGQVTRLLETF